LSQVPGGSGPQGNARANAFDTGTKYSY
jgi:hypothetical protein